VGDFRNGAHIVPMRRYSEVILAERLPSVSVQPCRILGHRIRLDSFGPGILPWTV
jgi:hypothetical protein